MGSIIVSARPVGHPSVLLPQVFCPTAHRWSEVSELFDKEERWEAVDSSARKELYDDFKVELISREKDRKRTERKVRRSS